MDSLFDTINVRDLLSTQDLSDPTSPLSAPDLRLLIRRLESHCLQIKSKVQSYVVSHQEDFVNLFSLCSEAVSKSHHMSDDVSSILRLSSDSPIGAEICQMMEEMKGKRELLGLMRTIVEMCERLRGAREGRVKFSAEQV
ncbi:hypothetical protein L6164_036463 [Bauhinia variegata]|uniref:Uncharacterized protein n=1 Tax=Bauhinia variegata TaxID=167791 RepID=A0ACB9KH41_BAUVA|nr:hypothetical protein L6164_036463 [Bauhinia variegata]